MSRASFANECVSRALLTLPWASIDPDVDATLRGIRDDIESGRPERISGALRAFVPLIDEQAGIHASCGNQLKADVLYNFMVGVLDFFRSLRTTSRGARS